VADRVGKLYVGRTIATLFMAPLILAPLSLVLFSGSATFAVVLPFYLSTYVFMFTWGLLTHVLLVQSNRTGIFYYMGAYLLCGIPVAFFLAEFTYDIRIVVILGLALLIFMSVPAFAWCLYYKLLSNLKF